MILLVKTSRTRREPTVAQLKRRRAALLRRLPDPGGVVRGSVTERLMRCGKATCRCQGDPRARHGPYRHLVTTVGRGKTRAVLLSATEARQVRARVADWRATLEILEQVSELNVALLAARRRQTARLR
ncbi:MAG: DUF6788 family protein [bacterium]